MRALPGFRDFYPQECAFRNSIIETWREVAVRYGFVEYDGPPLESLELYTKKSGDEIVRQLYNFVDKGERNVALRAEMTPTLARLVSARHSDYKKPMKWFSVPQLFRYERAQRGRLREHFQFNADILGEDSLAADAEVIAMAVDVLRAFGLGDGDFKVRLSDRHFWVDFLRSHSVEEEKWDEFFQVIDKSEREDEAKTKEKLGPLADEVLAILRGEGDGLGSERLDEVEDNLARRGLGSFVERDLRIVRGLAYYTGIVFELFDTAGELRAIAGGGRYDRLLSKIGGGKEDIAAVGFGMGDVVLGEMLKLKSWAPSSKNALDVYIVVASEEVRGDVYPLLQKLRDSGQLKVDYNMRGQKIGKQFEMAAALGARYAVVLDDKIKESEVGLKDLSSREQKQLKIEELLEALTSQNKR